PPPASPAPSGHPPPPGTATSAASPSHTTATSAEPARQPATPARTTRPEPPQHRPHQAAGTAPADHRWPPRIRYAAPPVWRRHAHATAGTRAPTLTANSNDAPELPTYSSQV